MAELIKIKQQGKPPIVMCPKCKKEFVLDLNVWQKDCSKILRDNCPKCNTELFVGVLILAHPSHKGFLECLKIMVGNLNPGTFKKL